MSAAEIVSNVLIRAEIIGTSGEMDYPVKATVWNEDGETVAGVTIGGAAGFYAVEIFGPTSYEAEETAARWAADTACQWVEDHGGRVTAFTAGDRDAFMALRIMANAAGRS